MERIYLDWNASAPTHPTVIEAMCHCLTHTSANPSSIHQDGQRARSVIENARRTLAKTLNATPGNIVFTGSATESNNQVLRSSLRRNNSFLIVSPLEHPSIVNLSIALHNEHQRIFFLEVDSKGRIDISHLKELLKQEGAPLVSIMTANNEIGNVNNIKKLASIVHETNELAFFHTDATQALGRIPLSFDDLGVDFLTVAFHKSGGPKGISATVMRDGISLAPLIIGGHQERGIRSGTENTPAAAGLTALCNLIQDNLDDWILKNQALKDRLMEHFREEPDLLLVGDLDQSLPNTLNVRFQGIRSDDLLPALDLAGISVSSGSACSSGTVTPSHVLLALGLPPDQAMESIRISFGPTTPIHHIDTAAKLFLKEYRRIRSLST